MKLNAARLVTSLTSYVAYLAALAGRFIRGVPAFLRANAICVACPLGFLQLIAASGTFSPLLAVGLAASLLLLLVFGRLFCGWMCLVGAVVHSSYKPSKSRHKLYAVAVVFVALLSSFIFKLPIFCLICPVGLPFKALAMALMGFVDPLLMIMMLLWLLVIYVASRRGFSWCGYMCPVGFLLGLVGSASLLRVEKNENCVSCGACAFICPSQIDLSRTKHGERFKCTLCLKCVSYCRFEGAELRFAGLRIFNGRQVRRLNKRVK